MNNVLLLNAGTRNVLVRYFKNELKNKAKVIVTDNFELAPALYDADKYYITKTINHPQYWDEIEHICDIEDIGLIVSLIDPELELLALNRERFETKGILVNTSSYEVIHSTFDKIRTLQFIKENNFPWIRTYSNLEMVKKDLEKKILEYPLFIKPSCGSGSTGIAKIENIEELEARYEKDFLIQEYMEGQEIGVDVFVDLISGELCSIFAKKKLKMRAGETDKSVSYKNNKLFEIIEQFVKLYGLRGANDIDVFEKNGEFYISEVNPRFGGGYLHAYECGVNFPRMLINNMEGRVNSRCIGNYKENVYMMKYFDVKMLEK